MTQWIGFPDLEPPAWPVGSTLKTSDVGVTSVTLTWNKAKEIWGSLAIASTWDRPDRLMSGGALLTYRVTDLAPNTDYQLSVQPRDASNNRSLDGPSIPVHTLPDLESPQWLGGGAMNRQT